MSEIKEIKDTKQFERFFIAHHNDVVRYALKFVRQSDVASDVVQEAFMKLWEEREKIVANVSLTAFLYKIVYNLSLNHIAQLKIRAKHHDSIQVELMASELDYYRDEKSLLQIEMATSVTRLIKELPKGCKELIEMSRYLGLKNKEIATKLNVPLRTIETRIYRCINRLRELAKLKL